MIQSHVECTFLFIIAKMMSILQTTFLCYMMTSMLLVLYDDQYASKIKLFSRVLCSCRLYAFYSASNVSAFGQGQKTLLGL